MRPLSPIFFLKALATPSDAFQELFSGLRNTADDPIFDPIFIPILDHALQEQGVSSIVQLLLQASISAHEDALYGGIIFTSQRAVKAFSTALGRVKGTLCPTICHDYIDINETAMLI
jgi:uroporphyrinogen-III synthase